jgi:hypothetical protein
MYCGTEISNTSYKFLPHSFKQNKPGPFISSLKMEVIGSYENSVGYLTTYLPAYIPTYLPEYTMSLLNITVRTALKPQISNFRELFQSD